ncbi:MAG: hypothetical protein RIT81_30475 [Deltaproteobacteria bacterium]
MRSWETLVCVGIVGGLIGACSGDDDDPTTRDGGVIVADAGTERDAGGSADAGPFAGCALECDTTIDPPDCDFDGTIPTEVDLRPGASNCQNRADFDRFSWQSFLGIAQPPNGASPLWASSDWVSTVDLLRQNPNPPATPTRFTPQVCIDAVPNATSYRSLAQVGKVNDSVFEAGQPGDTMGTGLSNDPVIAFNGTFVRYEVVISPPWYETVVQRGYNLAASTSSTSTTTVVANCASETDPWGAVNLKLAWMDVTEEAAAAANDPAVQAWLDTFHTEELLVVNPAPASSTNTDTCSLRVMALIGAHLVRKTVQQPGWVWGTFEHVRNAPDCLGPPPAGGGGNASPSRACPTASEDYNLYAARCESGAACAACNTPPDANGAGTTCTAGGDAATPGSGFCVDQPPAASAGLSRVCRQFPIDRCYPEAQAYNDACRASASVDAVWKNYELIATQWVSHDETYTACEPSPNVHSTVPGSTEKVFPAKVKPQLTVPGSSTANPTGTRPFLGNTSMESYERSNCASCHAKGGNPPGAQGYKPTDMSWWLTVEVPQAAQP